MNKLQGTRTKLEGGLRSKGTLPKKSMPDCPIVSVITVVRNGEKYLEETIKSVVNQTYDNVEYIIIDGGSEDGTLEIIKKYEDYIDYWVSEPDEGIYDAMNKGIDLATGEWINFMNAGDSFYDNNIIDSNLLKQDYYIIYGDAMVKDKNRIYIQSQKKRHFDFRKSIIHQSIFLNNRYIKNNKYNTDYKIMADYDNLLRLSTHEIDKIYYIEKIICWYNKSGVSSRPLYTYFCEYNKICKKYLNLKNYFLFLIYIIPRYVFSFFKNI